jgi:pimeloyl-ACP methyl ester carboxylesterase
VRLTTAAVVLVTLVSTGCGETEPPAEAAAVRDTLFTYPVTLDADGQPLVFEGGELYVRENRARTDSNLISIPFYRLRSTAAAPRAPIFVLAGGPGESALDTFASDEEARALVQFLRGVADVVLFDQRGAGHAQPRLDCPQHIAWKSAEVSTRETFVEELRKQALACREMWQQQRVDLTAYNTLENAADADALRKALGYERVSLVANSYGTHLALAIIRTYPAIVERALLYGIEGPDHTYDMPSQVLGELAEIARGAEQSPQIAPRIPRGGLLAALETVQKRLAARPVTVNVPWNGEKVALTISRFDVQRIARRGVHDLTNMTWPALIIDMYEGHFEEAARVILEDRAWPIDSAMYFMMDCASGLSPERLQRIRTNPDEQRAMEIIGDINLDYFATCDIWGNPDLGPQFRAPLTADTPVLFLQGTWDVSTPFGNAVETASGFRNGTLIGVERGSHFALLDVLRSRPDLRPLLQGFLVGKAIEAPRSIELPLPGFRVPGAAGGKRS